MKLLEAVEAVARKAGAEALSRFRANLNVETKADGSPVTEADRAAERAARSLIEQLFPDDGIVGEELGESKPGARRRWFVDPIDGTKAFIMGSPLWGTLIGLLDGEVPLLGMMNQPFTGERVWTSRTASHWRTADGRTRRIRTRACSRIEHAVLTTTSPNLLDESDRKKFLEVSARTRLTRYGGDCYGYAQLAGGTIDLVVETGLQPYDYLGPAGLIEAAGGVITDWEGRPLGLASDGRVVAAATPELHRAALALLRA